MSAQDFTGVTFQVQVTELGQGWRVGVDTDGDYTAEITAPDLDVALAMAVPYIVAIAKPDPLPGALEHLLRLPSAPDGPKDMG